MFGMKNAGTHAWIVLLQKSSRVKKYLCVLSFPREESLPALTPINYPD
jgi:hypothetical protein